VAGDGAVVNYGDGVRRLSVAFGAGVRSSSVIAAAGIGRPKW
jgi:hypothetical protein